MLAEKLLKHLNKSKTKIEDHEKYTEVKKEVKKQIMIDKMTIFRSPAREAETAKGNISETA